VSLGIFLCLLAPLIQMKSEADLILLGGQVLARMNQSGSTVKDCGLLCCCFCRLYHLDGMNLSKTARDFLSSLGLDQNYSQLKGEMTSQQVEQILVILMKVGGTPDYQIDQLYSQINMEPSVMLDCWWKFTQGNMAGQGTGGQGMGKVIGNTLETMAGGQQIGVGGGSSNLSEANQQPGYGSGIGSGFMGGTGAPGSGVGSAGTFVSGQSQSQSGVNQGQSSFQSGSSNTNYRS